MKIFKEINTNKQNFLSLNFSKPTIPIIAALSPQSSLGGNIL